MTSTKEEKEVRISQSKISSYPMKKHDDPELARRFGYPMHPMTPDSAPVGSPPDEQHSPAVPKELQKKGK